MNEDGDRDRTAAPERASRSGRLSPHDPQLAGLAIQVGAIDAERARGITHAPAMRLKDRSDIGPLEGLSGLAQGDHASVHAACG